MELRSIFLFQISKYTFFTNVFSIKSYFMTRALIPLFKPSSHFLCDSYNRIPVVK